MRELDCLGEMCPLPILQTLKALKTLKPNETLKVTSDHSCVVESLFDHLKTANVVIESQEVISGIWEIFITKTN